jgi:hypothetical protein
MQFEEIIEEKEFIHEEENDTEYGFSFETLVNLNENTAEYLDNPVASSLFSCINLLQMNSNSNFINSHSIEIQNRELQMVGYTRREDLQFLICAYIFMFLNQLGCQINNDLLRTMNIQIRPNDNPETIIKLLEFFEYIEPKNETKISNFIQQLCKIDNIEILHPSIIKVRNDFIGNGPFPRKYLTPDYNILLLKPIKRAIEEPIKFHILQKINNRITQLKGNTGQHTGQYTEQYKALLLLRTDFDPQLKKTKELIDARKNPNINKYYLEYYKELKQRQKITEYEIYNKLRKPTPKKTESRLKLKKQIVQEITLKINKIKKGEIERKVLEDFLKNFDNRDLRYTQLGNPKFASIIEPYIERYTNVLKKKRETPQLLRELLIKLRNDTLGFIKESKKLSKDEKDYLLKNFDNIIKNGRVKLIPNNTDAFNVSIYHIYMEYLRIRLSIISQSRNLV